MLNTYPKISETFVLSEMLGLEAAGLELSIFSVWPTGDPRFHPAIAKLDANVTYLYSAANLVDNLKDIRRLAEPHRSHGLDQALEAAELFFGDQASVRLGQALRLAAVAVDQRLEHLHAHFMLASAQVTYLAHLITGIPFTVTAHAFDIYNYQVDGALFRAIAAAAETLVTVCDANCVHIADAFLGGDRSRITRIYNGIPLDEVARTGAVVQPRTIFGAGRFVEKKGWDVLLQACRLLADQGCEFKCVIGGAGPEEERLLQMHDDLELYDWVEFAGPLRRDEVLEWMTSARVVACPSVKAASGDQDALPTVLLESLALGVPVVSTFIGGIPEIVENGVEGLLVPPGDAPALAEALSRLLDDDELWTALSEGGPKKIASTFDQRDTLPQLIDVLSGRGRAAGEILRT